MAGTSTYAQLDDCTSRFLHVRELFNELRRYLATGEVELRAHLSG